MLSRPALVTLLITVGTTLVVGTLPARAAPSSPADSTAHLASLSEEQLLALIDEAEHALLAERALIAAAEAALEAATHQSSSSSSSSSSLSSSSSPADANMAPSSAGAPTSAQSALLQSDPRVADALRIDADAVPDAAVCIAVIVGDGGAVWADTAAATWAADADKLRDLGVVARAFLTDTSSSSSSSSSVESSADGDGTGLARTVVAIGAAPGGAGGHALAAALRWAAKQHCTHFVRVPPDGLVNVAAIAGAVKSGAVPPRGFMAGRVLSEIPADPADTLYREQTGNLGEYPRHMHDGSGWMVTRDVARSLSAASAVVPLWIGKWESVSFAMWVLGLEITRQNDNVRFLTAKGLSGWCPHKGDWFVVGDFGSHAEMRRLWAVEC
jgi:hypothetical protein